MTLLQRLCRMLAFTSRITAECTGPCGQGRKPCPTPDACRLPEGFTPLDAVLATTFAAGIVLGSVSILIWSLFS